MSATAPTMYTVDMSTAAVRNVMTVASAAKEDRRRRREIADGVVTEADAGSAQARRKELGEVNRVAREHRELRESHHRQHPVGVARRVQRREHEHRDRMLSISAPRNASRRLRNEATTVKVTIPKNDPTSWKAVPRPRTRSTTSCGAPLSAVEINSGEKKPMPHSPIIPETPRNRPTIVFLRHRGSRKSSTGDPMFPFGSTPAAAAALAFSHESGSFNAKMIGTTISDGRMPTKNSTRQPEKPPTKFCAPGRNRKTDDATR